METETKTKILNSLRTLNKKTLTTKQLYDIVCDCGFDVETDKKRSIITQLGLHYEKNGKGIPKKTKGYSMLLITPQEIDRCIQELVQVEQENVCDTKEDLAKKVIKSKIAKYEQKIKVLREALTML